jgi:hypothetical protein
MMSMMMDAMMSGFLSFRGRARFGMFLSENRLPKINSFFLQFPVNASPNFNVSPCFRIFNIHLFLKSKKFFTNFPTRKMIGFLPRAQPQGQGDTSPLARVGMQSIPPRFPSENVGIPPSQKTGGDVAPRFREGEILDEEFLSAVTSSELLNFIRSGKVSIAEAKLIPVLVGGSVSFSVTNENDIFLKQSRVPVYSWLRDVREILAFCGEITLVECLDKSGRKSSEDKALDDESASTIRFLNPFWRRKLCRSEKDVLSFLKIYNRKAYNSLLKEEKWFCSCISCILCFDDTNSD